MKTVEISRLLHAKAEAGDTMALAALLIADRLSEMEERLRNIDGALTEIRIELE